jgi:hypothetical protein
LEIRYFNTFGRRDIIPEDNERTESINRTGERMDSKIDRESRIQSFFFF